MPDSLRHLLIGAAVEELYTPRWSVKTLGELHNTLIRRGRTRAYAQQVCIELRDAFEDATVQVEGIEISRMDAAPDDRHVVAAAVRSGADLIVTANTRHFPAAVLDPLQIQVKTPDEFLCDLFDLEPVLLARLVEEQAACLRNPPMSAVELAEHKLSTHAPEFVAAVRPLLSPD
ncbi:MAG: PIN domain-containing protein [Sphaerobacter sp.]|nr:PIN domain-containing protein [Sphaerobacter sp.]